MINTIFDFLQFASGYCYNFIWHYFSGHNEGILLLVGSGQSGRYCAVIIAESIHVKSCISEWKLTLFANGTGKEKKN